MNITAIIDVKERIAVGEFLNAAQRTFVLECINEAIGIQQALARTRAVLGGSGNVGVYAALQVFEIELQRSREGRA